jgi:hypothetical protein
MGSNSISEFEYVYLNPDGSFVSAFKAYDDAEVFRQYPDGNLVPNSFYEGVTEWNK